jgi:hypothetical protein
MVGLVLLLVGALVPNSNMRTTSVKGSEQSGVQPSPVASGLNQPTQVREPIVASGSRQQPPQWAAHNFKVDVGGHRVAATRKYRDVQANGRRAIVVAVCRPDYRTMTGCA